MSIGQYDYSIYWLEREENGGKTRGGARWTERNLCGQKSHKLLLSNLFIKMNVLENNHGIS